MLLGTEVKSIREGRVNLRDSFARVEDGEVFLYNVHISPYSNRGYADHEPTAPAQAAAAPPGDPQADRQDRREGHDAGAAAAVFQGRQGQGRDQPGQAASRSTTSASDPEARSGPGDARGRETAQPLTSTFRLTST